ncbi:MAG: serine protein kinase RIO [Dehalococcoidia bacterium]|nr:serine protein kinase RIO [Dehalococcoidia bacterium]
MAEILADIEPALEEFLSQGLVTEVLHVIKPGKEAVALLCRAHPSLGAEFVVAKVYHELDRRNFNRDAVYQDGRIVLDSRAARAIAARSDLGRSAASALWVDHEFETLSALHYAGADVPEPFFATERAILMSYAGDADGPAPQLQRAQVAPEDAPALFERLLWNVELFLENNVVHADLSPFNVLLHGGRPVVIDFPQAADPRFNRHARELLTRDVGNLARFFRRFGLELDVDEHVAGLWERWRHGALG